MKRNTSRRLALRRETLAELSTSPPGHAAVAGGTLTYEGSCGPTTCPCPTCTGEGAFA